MGFMCHQTSVSQFIKLKCLSAGMIAVLGLAGSAAAETHTVRAGQTLYTIARLSGTKVADLIKLNQLASDTLSIGQKIELGEGRRMPAGSEDITAPYTPLAKAVTGAKTNPQPSNQTAPLVDPRGAVVMNPAVSPAVNTAESTVISTGGSGVMATNMAPPLSTVSNPASTAGDAEVNAVQAQPSNTAQPSKAAQPVKTAQASSIGPALPPVELDEGTGSEPASWASIRTAALQLLGLPYIYGGNGSGGIDCSALTRRVMAAGGIRLPRTAAEQYHAGIQIGKADLRAGDLVFYDTEGSGHVTHVGLYLGGGKMINANSFAGRVLVEPAFNSYWYPRYVGSRRVSA